MRVFRSDVIVTENNFVNGFEIIEVGDNFEFSFLQYNVAPHYALNRFLAAVTNEADRLADKAIQKALDKVKEMASSKGWNAVLNFQVEFERVGEYASINCVNVHVYGIVCNLAPIQDIRQSILEQKEMPRMGYAKPVRRNITCWKCGRTSTYEDWGIDSLRCPHCGRIVEMRA